MEGLQFLQTPIGWLAIRANATHVIGIDFIAETELEVERPTGLTQQAVQQLTAYFQGQRTVFTFAFTQPGTPFQQCVWQALTQIPYGETRSYGELAQMIQNPKAVRAVGGANNKNKLAIVVPCHRVIGANGQLVGYAGGLERKAYLLNLERRQSEQHKGRNTSESEDS
ncbi:MAG: methylated-DNA--[protein]-cysteine S-methyltransferase [Culicoidibacterales bacterium]